MFHDTIRKVTHQILNALSCAADEDLVFASAQHEQLGFYIWVSKLWQSKEKGDADWFL